MRRRVFSLSAVLLGAALAASAQTTPSPASPTTNWPQWGQNARHTGAVSTVGQRAARILASLVYDPFVAQSVADPLNFGGLLVHYQAPLLQGNTVYMEFKTGQYTTMDHWETQIWNERRLSWQNGSLVQQWNFQSDWKPVPYGSLSSGRGPSWEPVFHAAISGESVYVPGFGGTVYKLDKDDGEVEAHYNPFGTSVDPNIFLTGPITADTSGNVYYNAVKLDTSGQGTAWDNDVLNSWLVKVTEDGTVTKATYASLVPGAPPPTGAHCLGVFTTAQLPWPPTPDAVPPSIDCGSVRTALNIAPAVGSDGTIYVPAVHHFSSRTAYMLAVKANLTPKWQTSMRDRMHDGCNVYLPPNGTPGGCRTGAHTGVDPAQNRPGAGRVIEDGTYSPTIAPDGSIFFGTYARYNWAQGHMLKFSASGQFLASYIFGWDITPAIYSHDGTYSVVMKDNHYSGLGSYCDTDAICPPDRTASDPSNPESFFITQLSKDLVPEWSFQNTNQFSCHRNPDGTLTCVQDHPHGFEWCINAPAVDGHGVVYGNSEDGSLYTINQGGGLRDQLFLNLALGAAYTPLAISTDGKIYTENDGILFVVGQ
ncbi:MAG TPA: hypothetical protein VHQ90_18000 [Thermoanaerobaculia bacterium]|nr:hypothetical protein [Thermoanaerobaculia bacterium]